MRNADYILCRILVQDAKDTLFKDIVQATEKAKKLEAEGKKEKAKATLINNKQRAGARASARVVRSEIVYFC